MNIWWIPLINKIVDPGEIPGDAGTCASPSARARDDGGGGAACRSLVRQGRTLQDLGIGEDSRQRWDMCFALYEVTQ